MTQTHTDVAGTLTGEIQHGKKEEEIRGSSFSSAFPSSTSSALFSEEFLDFTKQFVLPLIMEPRRGRGHEKECD